MTNIPKKIQRALISTQTKASAYNVFEMSEAELKGLGYKKLGAEENYQENDIMYLAPDLWAVIDNAKYLRKYRSDKCGALSIYRK